ncbi:MAG TPA: arylsulfatase [Verrucomicrobiae bacterium]|nr:arylsulfatase [Verrucomicrobiae bacterium]
MQRTFLRVPALALAAAMAAPQLSPAAPERPNFLVIVADDMGYSDTGCYGGEIQTPTLDRLANEGLRFTQVYSTGRCWPSRSCILTGYYAQQVRMDPPFGRLPEWTRVLPQYLKPVGYRSYSSGKWHLRGAPKALADAGFDRAYLIEDHNRNFNPQQATLDDRPLAPVELDQGYYSSTAIAQYAIDFLKEHAAQHAKDPFCLYLAFICPHFPLQAPQEDIARYRGKYDVGWDVIRDQRWPRMREMGLVNCALSRRDPVTIPNWNMSDDQLRSEIGPGEMGHALAWRELTDAQRAFQATKMSIHAAMIDRMDQEIARVLQQIKTMGAADNTVTFFVSDNGASAEIINRGDRHDPTAAPGSAKSYLCLGPGWSTAANTPFRLHKHWNHEGGIASPLIVHWPRGIPAHGELRHNPGHFIDILPTIADLAGASIAGPWNGKEVPPLPGKSLVPAFAKDGSVPREYLFFHHQDNRAIRVGDWKLVAKGKDGPWELYDISNDRCESNDLAAKNPDKVKELTALWQQREDEFRALAGPMPEPRKKKGGKKRP